MSIVFTDVPPADFARCVHTVNATCPLRDCCRRAQPAPVGAARFGLVIIAPETAGLRCREFVAIDQPTAG